MTKQPRMPAISSLIPPPPVPCLRQAYTVPNCSLWSLFLHSTLHITTDVISLNHCSWCFIPTDHNFPLPTKNTLQLKPYMSDPNSSSTLLCHPYFCSFLPTPDHELSKSSHPELLQEQRPCLIHMCGLHITMPTAQHIQGPNYCVDSLAKKKKA